MAKDIVSSGALERLSMDELVEIYNSTGPPRRATARTFKCVPAAVRVVLARLHETQTAERRQKRRGRRRKPLNLPPADKIGRYGPGTKRAAVIEHLRRGVTLENLADLMGWSTKLAREHIMLVNEVVGYGIEEDDRTGEIRLVRPRRKA